MNTIVFQCVPFLLSTVSYLSHRSDMVTYVTRQISGILRSTWGFMGSRGTIIMGGLRYQSFLRFSFGALYYRGKGRHPHGPPVSYMQHLSHYYHTPVNTCCINVTHGYSLRYRYEYSLRYRYDTNARHFVT